VTEQPAKDRLIQFRDSVLPACGALGYFAVPVFGVLYLFLLENEVHGMLWYLWAGCGVLIFACCALCAVPIGVSLVSRAVRFAAQSARYVVRWSTRLWRQAVGTLAMPQDATGSLTAQRAFKGRYALQTRAASLL